MDSKVSVRLNEELFAKLANWKAKGISLSDAVRQALILLPNSPGEVCQNRPPLRIKPLQSIDMSIQLKDEVEALKTLQEW